MDIDHLLEVDHLDPDLGLVGANGFLGGIGVVEVLSLAVLAGSGMVTTDDEMGQAVVLANDRMPERLARATHPHREVQKRQMRGRGRVLVEHRLVTAHAGEVVHVARLRHADDRVDEQIGLRLTRGAEGQFLMRAVQRVAGLEGDNARPPHLSKKGPQLVRCVATTLEVVVNGPLDTGDGAAEIDLASLVMQVVDRWVGLVIGTKDELGLARLVRHPLVSDSHGREDDTLLIA